MRRHILRALVVALLLAIAPQAARADVVTRSWEQPVAIGDDNLWDSDAGLAAPDRIVSVQQRLSSSGAARIGVTETNGRTGAATDTPLWHDPSSGYYPRLAVAPDGTAAAAFSDGEQLYVHLRRPGGSWHAIGSVHEGQTDYSDGRPLLAFTPLGHLVVAWPRKDAGGGQRLWLVESAPGSDALTTPRPLDREADASVVQVGRDLAVSPDGRIALAFLEGPSRTYNLTARVAFGRLGGALAERHALPGIVTPWSWRAPQVGFDLAGAAAIAWHTVPAGFDQGAALGDLHLVLRRADGTLGAPVDLGQTPTHGNMDLAVSDLGEVLLGFDAAGNLSGGGGSYGYSGHGYHGLLGSTVLGLIGAPRLLVPWPGDHPRLAMNRRGDALLAYTECCGSGVVRARRRVPGGAFGEPVLVAEGELTPAGGGAFYGTSVGDVALDELGNAMVSWSGFGPIALGVSAAVDGPLLDVPLPGLPLGIELPPILPALPSIPSLPGPGLPELPGLPTLIGPSAQQRAPATTPRPVAAAPLVLSVSAPAVRGVPRELRLRVRCDQPCAVQAAGRLGGMALRAFRAHVRAGRTTRLTVKLAAKVRRRARASLRRHGRTSVRVAVAAATASGGHAQRTLRVRLRRR